MQDFILALLMVQASYRQAIQKKMRELDAPISFEMLQVIRHLDRHNHINQQELANSTNKDKSSLSYLLNNMERKGLIIKTEDTSDKRNKLIALTEKAERIHQQLKIEIDNIYKKIEQNIQAEKLNICTQNMKELSDIINNE